MFIAWRPDGSVVDRGAAARGAGRTEICVRAVGPSSRAAMTRRVLRQHHDLGADIDPAEQIGDVLIGQADAARRDELADRRGIVGAVDAVLAGAEIHRARAERVARAAGHEARQIGLAR